MATGVYLLCALTSALCAALLLREYRRSRARLLLWSSISFFGFAMQQHARVHRFRGPAARRDVADPAGADGAVVAALLYGLVWDVD